MTLHRCLLIACVMLSHACDSKDRNEISQGSGSSSGSAAEVAFDGDAPCERLFEALQATRVDHFVLVVDSARIPMRYAAPITEQRLVVTMKRDGRLLLNDPKLATRLDEPGKNALRAALADVATRTGPTQVDIVIDREVPVKTLAELARTIRASADGKPLFPDVRAVAAIPSAMPTDAKMTMTANLASQIPSNEIQRCVNQSLARDAPTLGYQLTFALTVGKANELLDVRVSGPTVPPLLAQCLTTAALKWKVKLDAGTHQFPIDVKVE